MSRILRFFALVAVVFFSVNAFASDPYGSCSAKKVYTDCAEGYILQEETGECVISCSTGQYWNGSECKSCPTTHPNSEAGASSESECYKTAELMKNGGSGTCFGETGTLDGSITCYYGSTCALPSWNSSSCNMTNGSKIFKGWSLSEDATTGTTGDFVHGNTYYAVWVTPSCNITNGTGEVISALNNKPRCEVTCDSGYGTSGTYTGSAGGTNITFACTLASNTCYAGRYWDGSACQECTSGYYCPGGTWTGTAVQGLESCPDGYGNSEPGSVDESDCYLTTTAGKYVATPESAETTCAENGYCPGGIDVSYGDTDGRMACTANSSSGAGSDDISDCKCNAGYGGNAGTTNGTCTICAAGTYKTSSGNSSCSTCTAGYYCTGGANRTACTANSSSGAGSDDISDCKCNAGYGGNAGTTNGTCTICAAGTYKTSSGNTSCSTCKAGYYCTGGTNRTACTANSSSPAGSDEISDCQCNAGYGGNAGETNGTCTICAAGTYKTSSGNTSCSTCTEGYYCTGGTNQTTCPDGYGNSAPGSDAQSDCYMVVSAGYYLPTAGSTSPYACSKGSSTGDHEVYYGSVSQCSSCAPGSYTPYAGASCAECPAGYYCSGNGQATRCPALYPNSSAGSDAATDCYTNTLTGQYIATPRAEVVTDCQPGTSAGAHTVFYGDTSQCHVCKANQWSDDAAGSCQTCPTGWTNDGATAADHAYISSCKHTVAAGFWYNSVNSTFDTCATDTYSEAHLAGYGVSTSCESCNTGYTNNTDHTACVAICYKITLDNTTNGGTGGTTVLYKPHGSYLWYSDSSCSTQVTTITKPTKTNASYAAHYTSASSGSPHINSLGILGTMAVTGPTTLYAIYNCDANWRGSGTTISGTCTGTKSTVSFDANGGTGGQTADVTATYGSAMPIISTTKPTRTGYSFDGWTDAPQIGGTRYYYSTGASARTWDKTADTTLYAQWAANGYVIYLQPSPYSTKGTDKLYTKYGTNVYLDVSRSQAMTTSTNNITKPTRDGYTFGGYYSGSGGTGTEYIDANGYITSAGLSAGKECTTGCNWYARWIGNTYTVSFNANGGTGGQTASVTATYGSPMPTISTTPPTRTGYTFSGWYDAQTGGNRYYYSAGNSARTWDKTANTTLYAQWMANDYRIVLAPDPYNIPGTTAVYTIYDTNVYLDSNHSQAMTTSTNNITKPTRDGYTFGGYYSGSGGTGTEYIDANGYITSAGLSAGKECASASDCKWYVKWIQDCYQITLDNTTNGGTGGTTVLYKPYNSTLWYSDSSCSTQVTTITKPTKTNASYAGHYTTASGGTLYINASGSLGSNTVTGPITLYARYNCDANWRGSGTTISGTCTGTKSTVSFDANGGTGGQTADVTATYGSDMPTISTTAPTRTGYTFHGWWDAQTGGTQYYTAAGASARTWDKTANTTLYARWTANDYGITLVPYPCNVGGAGTTAVYTTYDTNVYLDSNRSQAMTTNANNITKPTYSGYTFGGYYSESGGTGTEYIDANGYITSAGLSAGKECASTTDCKWYAKWTQDCYKITLDNTTNGGTGGTTVLYKTYNSTLWYSDSSCSTFVRTITKPTKTNASYSGYYTSASGGTQYIDGSGSLLSKTVTGPITLYALYNCDTNWGGSGTTISGACTGTQSTVSFDINGGTGVLPDPVTATYGSQMPTISTTAPTRTGYTFHGWWDARFDGYRYYYSDGTPARTWDKTADTTLYAKWTANTYTVKYNANGGSGTTASSSHEYGVAKTLTANGFARTGYTFAGWATSSSGDVVYTNQQSVTNLASTLGATVNLYAKWTANTYTVKYNANGGSGSTASSSHEYDVAKTLTANGFTRTGYTFAGWATSPSGDVVYANIESVINLASTQGATVNLYAQWTVNTYRCTSGQYLNVTSCETCTAGYYCPSSSVTYTYNGSEQGRTACGGGKYSSDGATSCNNITAGCYGTSASSSCPAVCAANTYSDAGASACTSCDSDYANSGTDATSHAGVASCKVTCAAGTYVASANAACTDVGSGYYTTASQTISQGSTGSRSACSSLNAFYTASDSGRNATTDCYGTTSSGKYVSTAKSGEVTCAAGGYCAGSVKVYYNSTGGRTACGAGKYNASTGSSASSACTNITAGCYGTSASSSCPAVCAANTYSNAGASSCSSCPTDYKNSGDTAASHAGSASCIITVSGGHYIGTAGQNSSNWDTCACGTYKASHTVAYGSTSSCATTDAGYYAAAGASSQTKATAGYYAAAGACSQTACSGRTKYSAAGAASCSTVSTGYYTTGCNSSSNACTSQTICAKGTYCSSGVAYNCPGGTYGSTTGLSTNACSGKCTAGYYCPAGSASATQNACATNATSAAGSDAISDCVCKAGYSGDASTSSGTCTACACGYYKGSTGNTSCTKTTAGYYATGTGNTGQTKATAGNYAAAGACSQSSCADLGGGLYSSSAAGSDATNDCYATVPATKYLSSSTSTSFTTCTAGYYCPGKTLYYASTGGRTACGGGKYSEEGSDASSDCKTISAGCYGASASSACPNTCVPGSYSTGGASGCTICGNKPTNSSYTDATGNTSADCPWTCNDGYNQTSDNQCGQFCTAGITHIKSSNGLSVPLYSSARTSPAINVKVNDSVCYGSLATGQSSGALNVRVGSTTYHAID